MGRRCLLEMLRPWSRSIIHSTNIPEQAKNQGSSLAPPYPSLPPLKYISISCRFSFLNILRIHHSPVAPPPLSP